VHRTADVAAVLRTVVAVEELRTAVGLVVVLHTAVVAVHRAVVAILAEAAGRRSRLVDSSVPDSRSLVIQVLLVVKWAENRPTVYRFESVATKVMGYYFQWDTFLNLGRKAGDVLYKRSALGSEF
jgi:hypothetical protein